MPDSSSIGLLHRRQLAVTWMSSRGDRETILIGLKNSLWTSITKMPPNRCLRIFRPLSTQVLLTLELHALNPTVTSWAAFNYYILTPGRHTTQMYMHT